jgi:hypothetical protein
LGDFELACLACLTPAVAILRQRSKVLSIGHCVIAA